MNYITYHEWCRHLRNAAFIDKAAGRLESVATDSGISMDRLSRWLAKDLNLSHAEFIRLHEILAETHILGSEDDAVAKAEGKTIADECFKPRQCGCGACQSTSSSFDQSD